MADQPDEFPEFADPRRESLIGQAWDLLASTTGTIPQLTYVILWLCHIDNLARIVQDLSNSATSPERAGMIEQLLISPTLLEDNVIKPCEQFYFPLSDE